MKNLLTSFLILLGMTLTLVSASARTNQLFNFGWKFHYGDEPMANQVQYNDADWKTLDLPHDFQITQPWEQSAGGARGFKAMGTGWYRKSFTAMPEWKGKLVMLDFGGILMHGDVWVNGQKVGGTDYGYLGFETEISRLLRYDSLNVVSVKASTGKKEGSRWYTGGGLFRDVNLVVKNSVCVTRHGLFVNTSAVSWVGANVNLQVEVEGPKGKADQLEIVAHLIAPNGKTVAESKTTGLQRSKKKTDEFILNPIRISQPQLWDCEHPNLYTVGVALYLNGVQIDSLSERFGVRSIEFSKEYGFKLNGKKVFLKGIANHHDLGAVGAAAYETAIAREMDLLKKFGFNHIRTSHNPYSEAFLRLADEKGLLIVDELYDKWSNNSYWIGRSPWTELVFQNIPEWIKRDRNHPSVILWSFGNELQMREDLCGFQTGDWGVTTYRMLDVLAKRYDPTRKTTVAMFPSRAGGIGKNDADFNTKVFPPELATVTDVSSFNYRWMNYAEYLKHSPDMIVYQSEATTNELIAPYLGMDREHMVGLAYWGAISYWGESRSWPIKGWNFSFFDHSLNPFPQAYLVKSAFSDEPVVHIGVVDNASESMEWNEQTIGTLNVSDHWNREAGKKYNLYTFTNADEVELLLNGKSLGIQQNNRKDLNVQNKIFWKDVPYAPGKLTAIARSNGKVTARHELQTTGKPVALRLEVERSDWKADGMGLQYIKVYAVDSKGLKVPTATGQVSFDLSGEAKLLAVDNGDHSSDNLFEGKQVALYQGFALCLLRSTQKPGKVQLTATVSGWKPGKATMSTK